MTAAGAVLDWWDGVLPVLDFEATGTDPQEARMVSAALILCTPKGRTLHGGVSTLVNPGIPIPPESTEIHGITDADVADMPETPEVLDAIVECLWGLHALDLPLLIYNAPYDWPLLHAEMARHAGALANRYGPGLPPLRIVDPLVLDRGLDRYRKGSRKLVDTCRHYGVELGEDDAHDAFSDAAATAGLCRAIVRRYPELREMGTRELHAVQADMHAAWIRNFNRYRARKGQEPIPDVRWPGVEGMATR